MSHELYNDDQMFSVRERPWHFGETNSFVPMDYPGREEAIQLAGHDFEVVKLPVFEQIGDGFLPLDEHHLRRNSKTGHTFAVGPDSFEIVQNSVGWDLAEALLGEADIKWETGGTLKHGAVCWVLSRLNTPFTVPGDDSKIWPYLSVSWGHDGSTPIRMRYTGVREVCWNTLSMSEALAEREGRQYTLRHTKNVHTRIDEVKRAISGARADHEQWLELATELAELPISDQGISAFMSEFSATAQPRGEVSARVQTNIDAARGEFMGIMNSGLTVPANLRNTAYGVVQGAVEFLDHIRGYRSRESYCKRTILRDEGLKRQLVPLARRISEEAAA